MKLGSHDKMRGKEMFLGSAKEAASYGANAMMIYTGAPQNTVRKDLSLMKIEEGKKYMEDHGTNTDIVPNTGEVAKVFAVPLAQLMQPQRYVHYPVMRGNQAFQTVKFAHTEHICGATATILLALAEHYQAFVKDFRYGVGG